MSLKNRSLTSTILFYNYRQLFVLEAIKKKHILSFLSSNNIRFEDSEIFFNFLSRYFTLISSKNYSFISNKFFGSVLKKKVLPSSTNLDFFYLRNFQLNAYKKKSNYSKLNFYLKFFIFFFKYKWLIKLIFFFYSFVIFYKIGVLTIFDFFSNCPIFI